MGDCLRNLGVALVQGVVLLITFSALYILAYLVFQPALSPMEMNSERSRT